MTGSEWSALISFFALLLSVFSIYKSETLKRSQIETNKRQDELNEKLLAKENQKLLESKKAKLRVNVDASEGQLVIRNVGMVSAKNVNIDFDKIDKFMLDWEIKNLPCKGLQPESELRLGLTAQCTPNFSISIKWEDEFSKLNHEEFHINYC